MAQNDPKPDVRSPQEKKDALEAVLASEALARSEQLRSFLRFVCEMEMSGHAADITEYQIGVQALGRPPDFSPLVDSSVRTRAYELRQRLQKYYTVENPHASVRVELPKGTYTPSFQAVSPNAPGALAGATAVERWRSRLPWAFGWLGGFLAGSVVVSLLAVAVLLQIGTPKIDTALRQAWSPLITKDPEIVVCMSTPLRQLLIRYLDGQLQDNPRPRAPAELYDLFTRNPDLPDSAPLWIETLQKFGLSNVQSFAKILSTLQALHGRFRALPEMSAPLAALRKKNAVLIASPWHSRSASVLLEKTPWTTRWDENSHQVALFGGGKWLLPKPEPSGEYREVFGLVTMLPNDSTPDGPRSIVVLSGVTPAGVLGAASFFTSAADLNKLEERFHKQGLTSWPKAYQVVVRCRSAVDSELLSYAYESHAIITR